MYDFPAACATVANLAFGLTRGITADSNNYTGP